MLETLCEYDPNSAIINVLPGILSKKGGIAAALFGN
jgi:hypothetical protein